MRTPGFGDSDWTRVISELRLAGFTGSIDIEGWHDPVYRDELEMTGQVRALDYLKECRGGAELSCRTRAETSADSGRTRADRRKAEDRNGKRLCGAREE